MFNVGNVGGLTLTLDCMRFHDDLDEFILKVLTHVRLTQVGDEDDS